jgi:hypothetical protein
MHFCIEKVTKIGAFDMFFKPQMLQPENDFECALHESVHVYVCKDHSRFGDFPAMLRIVHDQELISFKPPGSSTFLISGLINVSIIAKDLGGFSKVQIYRSGQ